MVDYFTPTVIRPAIPAADMTPLERLLLGHIFIADRCGEDVYFYADERPAATIWLDRAPLLAALIKSQAQPGNAATAIVVDQLARIPADDVEITLAVEERYWERIFQDIVRRSPRLACVIAVSAFTCSKMHPDGFGGRAVVITADRIMQKSTADIIAEFLEEALPGSSGEPAHDPVCEAEYARSK
jgi:hypothetical protein